MNQHRLVICRTVIEKDLRAGEGYDIGNNERPAYGLIHQMTRLTRERQSLRHDDRLESLAGACAYYVEQAGVDAAASKANHEADLRDAELEKFMAEWDEVHGSPVAATGQPGVAMRTPDATPTPEARPREGDMMGKVPPNWKPNVSGYS
jgi:hypothetical protein